MTQRCSAPEFQKEFLVHVASHQAASEPNPPPDDSQQPMVSMPGVWQTHCSGCRAPAPETEPRGAADKHCTAGCRCLVCPDWFACLACAEKQVAAHQAAHPDEVHVVYCVATADDERCMLDSEATPLVISRWSFAFTAFVWPFLKMFLPCISVLLQVVTFFARLS